MAIFRCEKCGCAENTVFGLYWLADYFAENADWSEVGEEFRGKRLCSECAPSKLKDGTPTGYGKWHGKFPKVPYEQIKQ